MQYEVDVEHLEIHISLPNWVGIYRHKVVGTADLNAVPCVIEERNIRVQQFRTEGLHCLIHSSFVQIQLRVPAYQYESKTHQSARNELRILRGIIERGYVLICRVADDKCDTLLRRPAYQRDAYQAGNQD